MREHPARDTHRVVYLRKRREKSSLSSLVYMALNLASPSHTERAVVLQKRACVWTCENVLCCLSQEGKPATSRPARCDIYHFEPTLQLIFHTMSFMSPHDVYGFLAFTITSRHVCRVSHHLSISSMSCSKHLLKSPVLLSRCLTPTLHIYRV